jgi:hypothetical protein
MPSIIDTLRWWKKRANAGYGYFDLPPCFEEDGAGAFNPLRIRADEKKPSSRKWQPFPDEFVAQAGLIWLEYSERIAPVALKILEDLRKSPPQHRQTRLRDALKSTTWPDVNWPFVPPTSVLGFRLVLSRIQLSHVSLLSLLLGPRWKEVKHIRLNSILTKKIKKENLTLLDGTTFKFCQMENGEPRHWPVTKRFASVLQTQRQMMLLINGPTWKYLWSVIPHRIIDGRQPFVQIDHQLKKFVRTHGLEKFLGGGKIHHHRFRKTLARLVVIALTGGPVILRDLFGHETLAMTMSYILSSPELRHDLRCSALELERQVSTPFVRDADKLTGGGSAAFSKMLSDFRERLDVSVPDGVVDQAEFGLEKLLDVLQNQPEGMPLRHVLPGLVACAKPNTSRGPCSRENNAPDIARCQSNCIYHLRHPELGIQFARTTIVDSLEHLSHATDELTRQYWESSIQHLVQDYPELRSEFADRKEFSSVVRGIHAAIG